MNKVTVSFLFQFLLASFLPGITNGQSATDGALEKLVFERAGFQNEMKEDSPVYEMFLENARSPINLNTATFYQLQSLMILSDFQIVQLLDHIEKYGPLYSEYELQTIPGFDRASISNLLLFTEISQSPATPEPWTGYILGRTQFLLQRKKGFETVDDQQRFTGLPFSTLIKIRAKKTGKVSFGLTMENDAGEPIRWEPGIQWYGAGFTSGFIEINGNELLKKLIIGDLQANWGQGLVFGGGFSIGKGRFTTASQKNISSGLIPYGSTLEQGFMRGAGISLGNKSFVFSTLVSNSSVDANLNEQGNVSSLYSSGLFRNQAELNKKGNLSQKLAGINIHFSSLNRRLIIGVSGAYTLFDKTFEPQPRLENKYYFRDNSNMLAGAYFEYRKSNFVLFGEGASNQRKSTAYILGVLSSLSEHFETLIVTRNYSSGFTSFHSKNVFSESSSPQNENGFYWGLKFTQSRKLGLSAYVDLFESPWLKRSISKPADGWDYLWDIVYSPTEKIEMNAFFKIEKKLVNAPKELASGSKSIDQVGKLFKIDMKLSLSDKVTYKTGIWTNSHILYKTINKGNLFYSGISFKAKSTTLDLRSIITDSKDYSTRFYLYEPDILHAFSVPVYYGQNIRHIILIKQKFSSKLSCWLKLSGTFFRDRMEIGTGNDLIDGQRKTELKFQMVCKL